MSYKDKIIEAMNMLAKENYLFLGQNIVYSGTSMYHTLKQIPFKQRIELPVLEEMQMGMSIGMALEGLKVCSVFPRMDFLILAINQIVNHADKVRSMSDNQFHLNGLIVRTCVGSNNPMMPGEQHTQNYYKELKSMCKHSKVVLLDDENKIIPAYKKAMKSKNMTILIELADLYNPSLKEEIKKTKELKCVA